MLQSRTSEPRVSLVMAAGLTLIASWLGCGDDDDQGGEAANAGRGGSQALPALPAKSAGKACEQDADCAHGQCWERLPGGIFGAQEAPGGYCTADCTGDAQCGQGGTCVANQGGLTGSGGSGAGTRGKCYASCGIDSDCREGYRCVNALSVPLTATGGLGGNSGTCAPVPPTDMLEDGVVGKTCSDAPDCAGGTCVTRDELTMTEFPGGYCSGRCLSDAECGSDGVCAGSIAGAVGGCYLECEDDGDCGREGYRCRAIPATGGLGGQMTQSSSLCMPGAPPLPNGVVGRACSADSECDSVATSCRTQLMGQFGGEPTPLPGGYCSAGCIDASDCGEGGVCSGGFGGFGQGTCLKGCSSDNDCRMGYSCRAMSFGGMTIGPTACSPVPAAPPDQDAGVD
jgi:hypothetical protein